MISTVKSVIAEDLEIFSELNLDGDEYADNERALYGYALLLEIREWYSEGAPWVTLKTTQGSFDMPAGHAVKVKVDD